MASLTLEVWKEIESINRYVAFPIRATSKKPQWVKLYGDKKSWGKAIGDAILLAKSNGHFPWSFATPCQGKRSVSIVSYRHRLLDPGNLSSKAILDAMVTLGLLRDDNAKFLELRMGQISIPKKDRPWTQIELHDLKEI